MLTGHKTVKLTKEEADFVYNQINARHDYFEEVMRTGLDRKDGSEVDRGIYGRNLAKSVMSKILSAQLES